LTCNKEIARNTYLAPDGMAFPGKPQMGPGSLCPPYSTSDDIPISSRQDATPYGALIEAFDLEARKQTCHVPWPGASFPASRPFPAINAGNRIVLHAGTEPQRLARRSARPVQTGLREVAWPACDQARRGVSVVVKANSTLVRNDAAC
jgi:hypothetical protein